MHPYQVWNLMLYLLFLFIFFSPGVMNTCGAFSGKCLLCSFSLWEKMLRTNICDESLTSGSQTIVLAFLWSNELNKSNLGSRSGLQCVMHVLSCNRDSLCQMNNRRWQLGVQCGPWNELLTFFCRFLCGVHLGTQGWSNTWWCLGMEFRTHSWQSSCVVKCWISHE